MPRLLSYLPRRDPRDCSVGSKASPKAVTGIGFGIEPHRSNPFLDDQADSFGRESIRQYVSIKTSPETIRLSGPHNHASAICK